MRGAALPAALLCAALGLFVAFAPRRAILPAAILLAATAIATTLLPMPTRMIEVAFGCCWASIILLAAGVHLPRGVPVWLALAGAADAGAWVGVLIAQEGARSDLVRALPCVLLALPARWAIQRGWAIAVKVVSSWLIAIALLAALLPTAATPGYVPDHMQ